MSEREPMGTITLELTIEEARALYATALMAAIHFPSDLLESGIYMEVDSTLGKLSRALPTQQEV